MQFSKGSFHDFNRILQLKCFHFVHFEQCLAFLCFFLSWYLFSLDKINSFVKQLFRLYKRQLTMRSILMFLCWYLFFILLSLLVGVVSFQMGAMLACHNYWHWAVYHIEKVRTISFPYHPDSRKRQTTLEHYRRYSDNFRVFLREMF